MNEIDRIYKRDEGVIDMKREPEIITTKVTVIEEERKQINALTPMIEDEQKTISIPVRVKKKRRQDRRHEVKARGGE